MSAILTHLFKRNCWVSLGEIVAVTQCSRGQIDTLLRAGTIEVCNNHATGEEFRISPGHRRGMVSQGFDEYGHFGENNHPLPLREVR